MTLRDSIEILELRDEQVITLEILKKRFRKLAHRYHPDKYELETEKLKKTKLFIEVKQAYDTLVIQVSESASLVNPFFSSPSDDDEAGEVSANNHTFSTAQSKKERMSIMEILGMCSLPFGVIPLVYLGGAMVMLGLMKEAVRESKESMLGVVKLILSILFQILPLTVAGFYGLMILWEETFIANSWIGILALVQSSLLIVAWIWTYAVRKYLERKNGINYELINMELKE